MDTKNPNNIEVTLDAYTLLQLASENISYGEVHEILEALSDTVQCEGAAILSECEFTDKVEAIISTAAVKPWPAFSVRMLYNGRLHSRIIVARLHGTDFYQPI